MMTKTYDRLRSYRKGWTDSGGFKGCYENIYEHPKDYAEGYMDAKKSFRRAIAKKRKALGLPPEAKVHTA
jgi:hypothetical protein